jgi:hypothetical protein
VIKGQEVILTPRVGRLDSLHGVRLELVRIYRETRQGKLESYEATRLTYILQVIAKVLEQGDLEQRIERLEKGSSHHDTEKSYRQT